MVPMIPDNRGSTVCIFCVIFMHEPVLRCLILLQKTSGIAPFEKTSLNSLSQKNLQASTFRGSKASSFNQLGASMSSERNSQS